MQLPVGHVPVGGDAPLRMLDTMAPGKSSGTYGVGGLPPRVFKARGSGASKAMGALVVLLPTFNVSIVNTCWANASNASDKMVNKAPRAAKVLSGEVIPSSQVNYSVLTSLSFSIAAWGFTWRAETYSTGFGSEYQ